MSLDELKVFKHDGITVKGNRKLNSLVQYTYSEISLFQLNWGDTFILIGLIINRELGI